MGYRSRLGTVPKWQRERFLDLSCEDAERMLESSNALEPGALYRPYFHDQYLELGKYCQFEIAPEPFYTGFDIESEMECEFHILYQGGLRQIIREYHENVAIYYKELHEKMTSDSEDDLRDVTNFLRSRKEEWSFERCEMYLNADHPFEMYPYHLDREPNKRDGFIVSSWNYEYQIFNLTYLYSIFDWEKNFLIYSAW